MKVDTLLSAKFGKLSKHKVFDLKGNSNVVTYTRVSSKEQAEKNMSLETQSKIIQDCIERTGRNLLNCFGGTYESAKTDGRKEFNRMIDYIKKNKGKVDEIMVYSLDRFSRSGGAAIKLAADLREKYGVIINAVTQPVDTTNASGILSQGMHLLFSEFDNRLRSQRVVAGLKAKFEMGIWAVNPPQGYDSVKINGERRLILNAEGRIIAKAFQWKIDGIKNIDIVERLRSLGLSKMKKMQVQRILMNPFYCGMLSHGLLNGKVIEGIHEKAVSRDVFLKANKIYEESSRIAISHNPRNANLPLKMFLICNTCQEPLTGYKASVKVRQGSEPKFQYYYKCRTKGCCFNRNIKHVHPKFTNLLSEIIFKPELIGPLLFQLEHTFNDLNIEVEDKRKYLKRSLTEITKKIDALEEKYFVGDRITKEIYNKFLTRYKEEQDKLNLEFEKCDTVILNNIALHKALRYCMAPIKLWEEGSISIKEKTQRLLFSKGLVYNKAITGFDTRQTNCPLFKNDQCWEDLTATSSFT